MESKESWKEIHSGGNKTGFLCRKSNYDVKSKLLTWITLLAHQPSGGGALEKHRHVLVTSGLPDPQWRSFRYEKNDIQLCDVNLDGLAIQGVQGEKFFVRSVVQNTWPSFGTFMRVRSLPRFKGAEFGFGFLRERDLYLDRKAKLLSVGNGEIETPQGKETLWHVEEYFVGRKQNDYWLNVQAEIVVFQSPTFMEVRVPDRNTALEGLPGEITGFADTLTSR